MTWFALAHGATFAALLWALLAARRWPLLFALLTWPGTAVHELLHYLAGWLAGARPVSLSVLPRRLADRWVFGSVGFARLRWWNKVPVALAPLAAVPVGLWCLWGSLYLPWPSWVALGWHVLALQCLVPAWPSGRDWHHAVAAVFAVLLFTLVAAAVAYHLGLLPAG